MPETTTIRVEDAYPRPNARPLDLELVGRIADSITLIGFSPADPIVVRRDGNIYYVIDGGHRLAAAKSIGLAEIPAIVEDLDEASVLTYEGALNLQRPDTEAERWARAQQFLTLDVLVPETQIEVATGLSADEQRKAFKVIRKLNDATAAEDVTLDQALRAYEFVDDDEAFTAVMSAGPQNWTAVAANLQKQRNMAKAVEKCQSIIACAGCVLLDGQPKIGEYTYLTRGDEKPEEATHARIQTYDYSGGAEIIWYGPALADEPDPEANARREVEAARKADLEQAGARRLAFVVELLGQPSTMGVQKVDYLYEFAMAAWESGYTADAGDIKDGPLSEVKGRFPRVCAAILACVEVNADSLLDSPTSDYYLRHEGKDTLAYFDALQAAGFEPTETETAAIAAIAEALKATEDDACMTPCAQDWGCGNQTDGLCQLSKPCNAHQAAGGDE